MSPGRSVRVSLRCLRLRSFSRWRSWLAVAFLAVALLAWTRRRPVLGGVLLLGAVLTYGELYAVPEVKATALAAVNEAMAVAKAGGVTPSFESAMQAWDKAAEGLPPDFKASMLQSLEKGSLTEIDFINGAVVRAGSKHGVPTPVNEALVACIKGIERGLKGQNT